MRSSFERALDECLEAVRTGAADVEMLLRRYPRHAGRLRPLLEAAVRLGGEPPRPREQARGLARLHAALAAEREKAAAASAPAVRLSWATRSSLFVAAGLLGLIAIASGAAAASSRIREVIVPAPVHDFFTSDKEPARMQGVIRRVGDGSMVVESQREERNVRFSDDTKIVDGRGTPAPETTLTPGQRVTVAGDMGPDNTMQAQQVQVHSDDSQGGMPSAFPSATPSPSSAGAAGGQTEVPREEREDDERLPTSTATAGSAMPPDDDRRPSPPTPTTTPVPTATQSPSPTHVPDEEETSFTGVVTFKAGGSLTVTSEGTARVVVLDSSTDIEGDLAVGVTVRVRGTLRGDGSVLAREVRVLDDGGEREPTPKPEGDRDRPSDKTPSPDAERDGSSAAGEPTAEPGDRREATPVRAE